MNKNKIKMNKNKIKIKKNKITTKKNKIKNKIKNIIIKILNIKKKKINEFKKIKKMGADSLDTIEIIMEIENKFNIEIKDKIVEKLNTIYKITKYIYKKKK
ncbi:phosphopantetheine-binding protein [Buchnera aphidicola]|uniref:phosphopantetheine-binding protein n=1 Tax=Buchnera aphidicola TaxID=9 RepID=UPI0031B8344A